MKQFDEKLIISASDQKHILTLPNWQYVRTTNL